MRRRSLLLCAVGPVILSLRAAADRLPARFPGCAVDRASPAQRRRCLALSGVPRTRSRGRIRVNWLCGHIERHLHLRKRKGRLFQENSQRRNPSPTKGCWWCKGKEEGCFIEVLSYLNIGRLLFRHFCRCKCKTITSPVILHYSFIFSSQAKFLLYGFKKRLAGIFTGSPSSLRIRPSGLGLIGKEL